jgi:hypothetical protein
MARREQVLPEQILVASHARPRRRRWLMIPTLVPRRGFRLQFRLRRRWPVATASRRQQGKQDETVASASPSKMSDPLQIALLNAAVGVHFWCANTIAGLQILGGTGAALAYPLPVLLPLRSEFPPSRPGLPEGRRHPLGASRGRAHDLKQQLYEEAYRKHGTWRPDLGREVAARSCGGMTAGGVSETSDLSSNRRRPPLCKLCRFCVF